MFPTVFPLDCFSGKISKPRIHTRLAPASSGRLRWSAISPEPALCRLCCEPPPHAQIALALRMRFQHRSVRHPGSRRCSCACCAFRAAVAHGMNAGILRVAHASHAAHRYHGTLVPAMMAATGWQQSIRSGMTAPRSHHLTQRRGIRTGRQQHSQDECNSSLSKPFHLLRVISCLHIWHKPFRGSVCLFHFARPRPSRAPLVFVADKARGCCMQCLSFLPSSRESAVHSRPPHLFPATIGSTASVRGGQSPRLLHAMPFIMEGIFLYRGIPSWFHRQLRRSLLHCALDSSASAPSEALLRASLPSPRPLVLRSP